MSKFFLFFTLFFTAQLIFSSSDELVDQIWNELYPTDRIYPDIECINELAQRLSKKDNINKKFYGDGIKHEIAFRRNLLITCTLYPSALPTIKKLISLKVSLNDVDEDNKTALLYAIRFINHEAIHELLQAGADPNIQDRHGKTALMYTTNQHFIYFLLEYGADGRIKDHEGKTIFDNPYFHNFAPCTRDFLLEKNKQAEQERQASTCVMQECNRYNTALFGNIQNLLGTPNYPQK